MIAAKRRGAKAVAALGAAVSLVLLTAMPAAAASASGTKVCSSIVRISSTTTGTLYSVTHSWSAGGGGGPGYAQWFTNGAHSNLTNNLSTDWLVQTASGGSISSASASCSGIT